MEPASRGVAGQIQGHKSVGSSVLTYELTGGEDLPQLSLALPEGPEHGLEGGEGEQGQVDGAGPGGAGETDPGHQAQRALAPDHEVLQVVASVVLLHGGETVQDLTAGQDGLHPEDGAVQAAVPQQPQTSGVGGDVPSDVAAALGPQVQRHHQTVAGQLGVELLQDDPGLAHRHPAVSGHALYPVHELGGDDHLVKDRDAATHQASVAALGTDGQTSPATVSHQLCHLLRVAGSEDTPRGQRSGRQHCTLQPTCWSL